MSEMMRRALNKQLEKMGLTLGICCGAGSSCQVYKVYKAKTGLLYGAAKVSLFSDDENISSATDVVEDNRHAMLKETEMMRLLSREPNVVTMLQDLQTFRVQGREYGFFIMEPLASMTESEEILRSWIRTYGVKTVLAYIGFGIASALNAAYSKNKSFSHRDIKTSNLFVKLTPDLSLSRYSFKLADFGISNASVEAATHDVNIRNRLDLFRCPDAIPSIHSDIYSLGCVLGYYGNFPFNDFPGSRTAADYGKVGQLIEKMLSRNKSDRPSLEECMKVFGDFISGYEDRMCADERVSSAAIQKLNAGKTDGFTLPQDSIKAKRYCGIRDWLRSDRKSASLNFSAAGDTISRFYLASIDVQDGNPKAVQQLLQLRKELDGRRCHLIFDNILALLFGLGYPLNKWEQATAIAVLSRADEAFTFY